MKTFTIKKCRCQRYHSRHLHFFSLLGDYFPGWYTVRSITLRSIRMDTLIDLFLEIQLIDHHLDIFLSAGQHFSKMHGRFDVAGR